MALDKAKTDFLGILNSFPDMNSKYSFLHWVSDQIDECYAYKSESDVILESIQSHLKSLIPKRGCFKSENIKYRCKGPNEQCTEKSTIHVDSFLYCDDELADMIDKGKIPKWFCSKCGSRDIDELKVISHSMAPLQSKVLFTYCLPSLHSKTFVDIGSRLGSVLYSCYLYSDSSEIYGIEMNKEFCNIQNALIKKYSFQDRIKILEGDFVNFKEIISKADVVVMNNVFEFFCDTQQEESYWKFLRDNLKSDSLLLTIPALRETHATLWGCDSQKRESFLSSWLTEVSLEEEFTTAGLHLLSPEYKETVVDSWREMHLYKII